MDQVSSSPFLLHLLTQAHGGFDVVIVAARGGPCVVLLCKLPLSKLALYHGVFLACLSCLLSGRPSLVRSAW